MTGNLEQPKAVTLADMAQLLEFNLQALVADFGRVSKDLDRVLGVDINREVITERKFRQRVMGEILHSHVMRDLMPHNPAGLHNLISSKGVR